jgi:hypothetical protein
MDNSQAFSPNWLSPPGQEKSTKKSFIVKLESVQMKGKGC